MKIATWNVNGIRKRQAEAQEWISRERPDILCLQELKASSAHLPAAMCEMEGYWCYWHGEAGYSGVGLHINKELMPDKPEFSHPPFDFENRIVCARIGTLTVASIYVPNGGKDYPAKLRFLEALIGFASSFRAEQAPVLLCGDLNIARTDRDIHPKEFKANAVGHREDERALLEQVIAQGLVDVGRAVDPDNDNLFTWWAPWRNLRQRNIGWRIDYILASEALHRQTQTCVVQREVGTSDHAPVMATFDYRPDFTTAPRTE